MSCTQKGEGTAPVARVKDKQPVAQIWYSQEHCFAPCFAALFTHYRLEFHSISQTRPKIPGLRHANCPSGRLFSLSGYPKMLEGATREKFFLLIFQYYWLYVGLSNKP